MIAKVRRRKISSLRLLINPLQLFPGGAASSAERNPAPTRTVDMMAASLFANAFPANPAHLLSLQEKYTRRHSRRRGKVGNPWNRAGITLTA
jgi:hypothetical protein